MLKMSKKLRLPFVLAFLFAAYFAFVWTYLARERTVFFWDYAMYANMAIRWFALERPNLAAFRASFTQDYNLLFALPSFLSFSLFGASRFVFVLTVYLFFFVPHLLALGVFLKAVYRLDAFRAFSGAALLAAAIPFLWYPLLEGYPDDAAATCLTLAVALALIPKKTPWRGIGLGALLALAVLFRRHYAYPALALLGTMGLFDLVSLSRATRSLWLTKIKSFFLFYATLGLSLLGGLYLTEPDYFQKMIATDFLALYKSYERTPEFFLDFFFNRLGSIVAALTVAGFFLAFRKRPQNRPALFFIFCLGAFWLLLWCVGPCQAGDHYLLAVPPLLCLVGLFGFFLSCSAWFFQALGAGVLILNAFMAFAWGQSGISPVSEQGLRIFSAPRPPQIRSDLAELEALARYVSETTTDKDRIVVVGSSFLFNQDLLRALYTDILRDDAATRRFLPAPEIDGKQAPPLNVYASANVYLVAEPTQYHLNPEGQKVVTALARSFPPPEFLEPFFQKDSRVFSLENGTLVRVWRRKPWTPGLLHRALAPIKAFFPQSLPWVVLNPALSASFFPEPSGITASFVLSSAQAQAAVFLDRSLIAGVYRLGGTVLQSGGCSGLSIEARLQNENGQTLFSKQGQPIQNPGLFYLLLSSPAEEKGPFYVTLTISATPKESCAVAFWQLQLEEKAAEGLSTRRP